MTRYDILPDEQRDLLPALASLKDFGFVLYGGTAIALQLGHRVSVDFDFFSEGTMQRDRLSDAVPLLSGGETLQDEMDTWTVWVGAREPRVKLSFFSGLSFGRVGIPRLADHGDLLLASLHDLLGHKLKVLLQRVEAKDYRDIAAMLEAGHTLEDGLGAASALFPNLPPAEVLRALVYFEGGDLSTFPSKERDLLRRRVSSLGPIAKIPLASTRLVP